MIHVTHAIPVNAESHPHLTRDQVWHGLVLKANDALPFVQAMTECRVTARHGEDVFDRDVVYRGQAFSERVTLLPQRRVVFTRTAGPVLGTIANEIEGEGEGLHLRFTFALVPVDLDPGSREEREYAEQMTDAYLGAVTSTLAAVRRMATEPAPA